MLKYVYSVLISGKTAAGCRKPMTALPPELLEIIFEYVGWKNLSKLAVVCKRFRDLAEPILWKDVRVVLSNTVYDQGRTMTLKSIALRLDEFKIKAVNIENIKFILQHDDDSYHRLLTDLFVHFSTKCPRLKRVEISGVIAAFPLKGLEALLTPTIQLSVVWRSDLRLDPIEIRQEERFILGSLANTCRTGKGHLSVYINTASPTMEVLPFVTRAELRSPSSLDYSVMVDRLATVRELVVFTSPWMERSVVDLPETTEVLHLFRGFNSPGQSRFRGARVQVLAGYAEFLCQNEYDFAQLEMLNLDLRNASRMAQIQCFLTQISSARLRCVRFHTVGPDVDLHGLIAACNAPFINIFDVDSYSMSRPLITLPDYAHYETRIRSLVDRLGDPLPGVTKLMLELPYCNLLLPHNDGALRALEFLVGSILGKFPSLQYLYVKSHPIQSPLAHELDVFNSETGLHSDPLDDSLHEIPLYDVDIDHFRRTHLGT
ncbi:hypothetical protein TRVA0_005S03576 [Trichomonascus vanleenenianus]|uniref:F-box protein n=1 Tax=Trichomonascus vanleenenianus TaxID=2268995 RepID=UPI003ECB4482